jgi:glycerol-3-phosphate acyltransferase PlsX
MNRPVTISVDAMGGDHGPGVTVAGAELALRQNPGTRFVFFGDAVMIEPIAKRYPSLTSSEIVHCDITVDMSDKPSQALRRGRWKSGMWRTIDAVRRGEADVAVSAGNTGALMAMSRFCLKTLAGMDRPAIAALWPTLAGESVVLDVGATIGADAKQLVDYAVMGGAMARALFEKSKPTVGLLNIGVEEVKGLEQVREAGRRLREANLAHLDYVGFIEGDDLGKGMVDVAVTEGFAGNIALKTAEGTARQVAAYLREEMGRTLRARLGYMLAKPAMNALRRKLDPNRVNGGVLLGLNGIVIKSHGGTDAAGFAAALGRAVAMVRNGLQAKIQQDHAHFQPVATALTEPVRRAAGGL